MMSANTETNQRKVTYDNIISFIRDHEEPCVTASEIASEFQITSQAANYRLGKLKESGDLQDKVVGASAKIWYLSG